MKNKPAAETKKLICDSCNFENEIQRIYCHNCGGKLDRSSIPVTKKVEPAERAKALSRKLDGQARSASLIAALKWWISIPLTAVVTASLVTIFKPNPEIVPLADEVKYDAPAISFDLEDLQQSPAPRKVTYTSAQVDGFVSRSIKPNLSVRGGFFETGLVGVRAGISDGVIRVTMVQSVGGLHVQNTVYKKVSLKDGKLETVSEGGRLGAMSVPPPVMDLLEPLIFKNLWAVFDREQKLLQSMKALQVDKDSITIVGGGS